MLAPPSIPELDRLATSTGPDLYMKRVLYEAEDTHSEERTTKMSFMNSGHWFVWDPCGIVCAVMTYILILYGEVVVLTVLLPPFPTLFTGVCVFIFSSLAALSVVSHVKAMITDPVSLIKSITNRENREGYLRFVE